MSLLPPTSLTFTLSELEKYNRLLTETVEQFCVGLKGNGDADAESCRDLMSSFLGFAKDKIGALEKESSEAGEMLTTIVPVQNSSGMDPSSPTVNSEFSSIGKRKSKRSSITQLKSNKIVPMMSHASTALTVFTSPEANQHIKNLNKDLDLENDKVLPMTTLFRGTWIRRTP